MYFVIYDFEDNIIAYIDNLEELYDFLHLKSNFRWFRHYWNNRYSSCIQLNNKYYKCYKFN